MNLQRKRPPLKKQIKSFDAKQVQFPNVDRQTAVSSPKKKIKFGINPRRTWLKDREQSFSKKQSEMPEMFTCFYVCGRWSRHSKKPEMRNVLQCIGPEILHRFKDRPPMLKCRLSQCIVFRTVCYIAREMKCVHMCCSQLSSSSTRQYAKFYKVLPCTGFKQQK